MLSEKMTVGTRTKLALKSAPETKQINIRARSTVCRHSERVISLERFLGDTVSFTNLNTFQRII